MKLKILKDYDFRLKPTVMQAFRAGTEVEVPKQTAEALIKVGVADPVTKSNKD